ncbi:YqaJ viral recombinase family protein [Nitrospira sp. BLG_2]|uniref:YqaJ viral recombinase family nuclease n=1 Tax=Nitrospira sp. BLG_2 TaxID=3397507 RepID=UPI003B9BE04A
MSQEKTIEPQLAKNERTTGLGGHDIGAICGVHPFLTAFDVYNEKVNGVSHFEPQYIQKRGLYLEKFLIEEYLNQTDYVNNKENYLAMQDSFFRHKEHPYFYAHPDYVFFKSKGPIAGGQSLSSQTKPAKILECKAPAIIGKEWGEEGTFEVPDYIKCQAAWYCMVIDCDVLDIVVDSPFKLKVYTYNRDKDLEAQLMQAGIDFWNNHVLTKVPPEPQNANDVRELYRKSNPDTTIEADEELSSMLFRIKELQGHIKNFEQQIEGLKCSVQTRMKDNETIQLHGVTLATWKPCTVTRLDIKALKDEQPDIYNDYMSANTSRRFLVK